MNAISPHSCPSSSHTHTHTHQWKRHGMGTSRQDRACSNQAGHSLFHVCYWKCKRTHTGSLTVLPVLLLRDIYEEHQTALWSLRSRPFSTAITWVDKGIPKANHFPSSLLWTWVFSAGESLRETQSICKHFHSGDCMQRVVHCVLQQHS